MMSCRSAFTPNLRNNDFWNFVKNIGSVNVSSFRKYGKGNSMRTPYEILGLHHTCTTQEIKDAYIKLCKELHPDMKPGDASQHRKFIEVNGAYTTLINSASRREFDNLQSGFASHRNENGFQRGRPGNDSGPFEKDGWGYEKPWYEREEYRNQFRQQSFYDQTKGANNLRKTYIVVGCFLLMCIGSLLFMSAFSFACNYKKKHADEKSKRISKSYEDRKAAMKSGNKQQLENLRKRWSS